MPDSVENALPYRYGGRQASRYRPWIDLKRHLR